MDDDSLFDDNKDDYGDYESVDLLQNKAEKS